MKSMWVGFAFFTGVLVLGFATLMIKDINIFFEPRIQLFIGVDEAMGLEPGDDVRVDGIPIGKVKYVGLFDSAFRKEFMANVSDDDIRWINKQRKELQYQSQGVAVIAELFRPVELYEDAVVSVEGLALIGGAYLSIKSGSIDKRIRDIVAEGVTRDKIMIGKASGDLMKEGAKLIEENRVAVKELLENLRDTSKDLKEFMAGFKSGDGWLADELKLARGDFTKTMEEATAAIKNISTAVDDVKMVIEDIKTGKGTVGKLITSDELHTELVETVKEARSFIKEIKESEGTFNALVNDKKMAEDLKETIESVKSAADDLKGLMEKANKGWVGDVLQDEEVGKGIKKTVSGLEKSLGRIGNAKTFLRVDSNSFSESEMSMSHATIFLWPDDTKYIKVGGVFWNIDVGTDILYEDMTEPDDQDFTKIDAQLGYQVPWFTSLWFRAGLIEGKPGAAFDLNIEIFGEDSKPIEVSFEARRAYDDLPDDDIDELVDTGNMLYRTFVRSSLYPFKLSEDSSWFEKFLSTIHVTVGTNRLFSDDPEIFFGIGIHYEEPDIKAAASLAGGP